MQVTWLLTFKFHTKKHMTTFHYISYEPVCIVQASNVNLHARSKPPRSTCMQGPSLQCQPARKVQASKVNQDVRSQVNLLYESNFHVFWGVKGQAAKFTTLWNIVSCVNTLLEEYTYKYRIKMQDLRFSQTQYTGLRVTWSIYKMENN